METIASQNNQSPRKRTQWIPKWLDPLEDELLSSNLPRPNNH